MKLSVLGATGQSGQFLVKQALDQGHIVTALVRNTAKLPLQHQNLKVIFAESCLAGCRVVTRKGREELTSTKKFALPEARNVTIGRGIERTSCDLTLWCHKNLCQLVWQSSISPLWWISSHAVDVATPWALGLYHHPDPAGIFCSNI